MAGWHTDSMDVSLSERQELVMNREAGNSNEGRNQSPKIGYTFTCSDTLA